MSEIKLHCGKTELQPEASGYNPEKIQQLDSHLSGFISSGKLQCASYMLSRNGKPFACKSMGKLTYHDDSSDFMPDSIRFIASVTKMFTAIAVMKQVEEGKLRLDQPVASILKEFDTDLHRTITIRHLLTHTSGLCADTGYFNEPYPSGWWHLLENKNSDDENYNWIQAILSGPVQAKPGEKWNYSSSCFMILGEIVTRLAALDCEKYIIEKIVRPLGMKDTFFDVPQEHHHRVCYTNKWNENNLKSKEDRSGHPPRTSGGMYSTLADLSILGHMMLNYGEYNGVRILGRKTVEAMIQKQLSGVPAFHWGDMHDDMPMGLGLTIKWTDLMSKGTFGHEGAGRCGLYIDPTEGFVVSEFEPTNIEWLPESVVGTNAIIWSGLL